MDNIKQTIENAKQSPVETYDATELSVEEVLAQIESSMQSMDENTKRRVVFTNSGETFEDVLDNKK
ncbi:hypothetical protein RZE82_00540 [Mollicutes bacterium LVI A0039]|nr:hypothetical protein RZE82_00540 [Mollicutes bacterium LVI A0039]